MLPLYEINDATPNHASATHCYLKHADHPNVAPEARGNCSGGGGGFGLFFKFFGRKKSSDVLLRLEK